MSLSLQERGWGKKKKIIRRSTKCTRKRQREMQCAPENIEVRKKKKKRKGVFLQDGHDSGNSRLAMLIYNLCLSHTTSKTPADTREETTTTTAQRY